MPALADAVHAATEAVLAFGAVPGDKTMVDALVPFDSVLRERTEAGDPSPRPGALRRTRHGAAADDTAAMLPRKGRARTHAEQAVGTVDPGAESFALVVAAVAP